MNWITLQDVDGKLYKVTALEDPISCEIRCPLCPASQKETMELCEPEGDDGLLMGLYCWANDDHEFLRVRS